MQSANGRLLQIEGGAKNVEELERAARHFIAATEQLLKYAAGIVGRGRRPTVDKRLLAIDYQAAVKELTPIRRLLTAKRNPAATWPDVQRQYPKLASEIERAGLKDAWLGAARQDVTAMACQLLVRTRYPWLTEGGLDRLTRARAKSKTPS